MMEDAIRNFHAQFAWKPQIANRKSLSAKRPAMRRSFVVCGMGGSHLAADLLQTLDPSLDVVVWKNYGLPPLRDIKDRFIIFCSYSGNTEEVIEGFHLALRKKFTFGIVAKGGKLIDLAKKHEVPYVQVIDTGIQPRSATGFMFLGLLAFMGRRDLTRAAARLTRKLDSARYEREGKKLAGKLRGKVPVVYASAENWAVAEIVKIRFNETAKIPSFWNVLPELNHNEMTSFDAMPKTRSLSRDFHFLIFSDSADHPQNQKRVRVLARLLKTRGFGVEIVPMLGKNKLEKVFGALLIGDWAALYLSKYYGAESEQVSMVEEFKRLIA